MSEKTTLSTYLPVELAEDVARLAAAGNRSISREVAQAIREHVTRSSPVHAMTGTGEGRGGAAAAPAADAGGEF